MLEQAPDLLLKCYCRAGNRTSRHSSSMQDSADSPHLGSFSSAEKKPSVSQVKKPLEVRGVENKTPAIFILWSAAAAALCPWRAQGNPGDSRNQEGMLQPGKHIRSSAVPTRQNMQPGYHFQSVQKGQSGPKGRG